MVLSTSYIFWIYFLILTLYSLTIFMITDLSSSNFDYFLFLDTLKTNFNSHNYNDRSSFFVTALVARTKSWNINEDIQLPNSNQIHKNQLIQILLKSLSELIVHHYIHTYCIVSNILFFILRLNSFSNPEIGLSNQFK